MGITSVYFLVFLAVVVGLYYLVPGKLRVYLILLANVVFYAQFGLSSSMIFLAGILCAYLTGRILHFAKKQSVRKMILFFSLLLNIGLLACTKTCWSAIQALSGAAIAVPIGVSFYTLQLCSYMIDVYRKKYAAEKNPLKFAAYASFFPLTLQGPISRYDQLAPQLFSAEKKQGIYHNVTYGAQRMLWGFFKKLVIADRCAIFVNAVLSDYGAYAGWLNAIAPAMNLLQLYTDFSGCVDICVGAAQMMGITLMENFRRPFLCTSISDTWRRWHISLSSWLKDYVYIPLGGSRKGFFRQSINLMIVFALSALWHGIGVQFLILELSYAIFQIAGQLLRPVRKKVCKALNISKASVSRRVLQFLFIVFFYISLQLFFCSDSVTAALEVFGRIFTGASGSTSVAGFTFSDVLILIPSVIVLLCVSIWQEKGGSVRDWIAQTSLPIRWGIYLMGIAVILLLGVYGPGYSTSEFIYMNF